MAYVSKGSESGGTVTGRAHRPRVAGRRLAIGHWWWFGAIGLAALYSLVVIWSLGADRVIGVTWHWEGRPINTYDRVDLGQTFRVPSDGLHRLDVMLLSYASIRPGRVQLSIVDQAGNRRARSEIDSRWVRDSWIAFDFEPINGLTGQSARLVIERPSSWRSPIGVRVTPGTSYAAGTGLINDEADPSFDLAFRAYFASAADPGERWQQAQRVAQSLTMARPGLFGWSWLPLLLAFGYASGLAALTIVCLRIMRR